MGMGYPLSDSDIDLDIGRLKIGVALSRLAPPELRIDSTSDKRPGRTGRGYKTVRRLLRELTDLTVYE